MATGYRTPSPLRHTAFAVAGLATLVFVLLSAVFVLDRFSQRTERSVSTWRNVESLDIDVDRGEIEIVPARGRETVVRQTRESGIVSATSATDFDGRTLTLEGGCRVFFVLTCEVDYRVEVPRGTAIDIRGFAGSITVRDVRGNVRVDNKAGDVRAINVRGDRIDLRTRAGDAEARDVAGKSVSVRSAAGDADARLLAPARDLRVETHAGDATAVVPDVGYRIEADSDAGETSVKVKRNDLSRRTVQVRTNAGDAAIRALSER